MQLPSFPHIDLFAAGINALYGALLARTPSHDRNYTAAGILIIAFIGGVGGGITRDILLNTVPGPFTSPVYLVACLVMGLLGLALDAFSLRRGELFRKRTLAVLKSFSLPWFALLGTHKSLELNLGVFAAILVGLIATTAGGVIIDLFSGVTPEVVRPSEHVVTTAVVTSATYALLATSPLPFFHVTLIAVGVGFTFRMLATHRHWRQIVPKAVPTTTNTAAAH